MQNYYESSDAVPLYDPGQMKEFADKSAPGRFDVLLQSILREDPRLSEEHRVLQEKRTVKFVVHNSIFQVLCPVFSLSRCI